MSESHVSEPFIVTRTGIRFELLRPTPAMVEMLDIATSLSRMCRFTGHTERFYSVAEHCVHCSYLVPREHALAALLHDAAETYIGDINSPLKSLISYVHVIERRIAAVVAAAFGVKELMVPDVVTADETMLHVEAHSLMPWADWIDAEIVRRGAHVTLFGWAAEIAQVKFLRRLHELTGDSQ